MKMYGGVDVHIHVCSYHQRFWGNPLDVAFTLYDGLSKNRNSVPGRDKVYTASTATSTLRITLLGPKGPFTEGRAHDLFPSSGQLRRS
jgi:hypothetical protein